MPVWHKATQEWIKQGRLVVLGIAQEHHADRCRLFAQWKRFDFPILHDPINVVGPKAVPIIIAIDEYGIVRAVGPKLEDFERNFLNKNFEKADLDIGKMTKPSAPDIEALHHQAEQTRTAAAWITLGDAFALWHSPVRINEAISAYSHALGIDPEEGATLFRLGECYFMRYESDQHQPGDFQRAINFWGKALSKDPNQYIWRRRIQQYGPRLDKPYPFYDWIRQAEADIRDRGESPVVLQVLPSKSEIAQPIKKFLSASEEVTSPDPEGRIHRDSGGLIETEVAIVPMRVFPGESARVHVNFKPSEVMKAHWNNEVDPLRLWVNLPEGWKADNLLLVAPQPDDIESNEIRRFDFGVQLPQSISPGHVRFTAYALYYACEGIKGVCQFLRQDIDIEIEVVRRPY